MELDLAPTVTASPPALGAPSSPLAGHQLASDTDGAALHGRPWERSPEAAAAYATYTFPLTSLVEVRRLLADPHLAPTWLLLGDFTATWAQAIETVQGVTALVVDRRAPEGACLAYQGDFHDVLTLCYWDGICAWPSCTHQAVSNDDRVRTAKALDGRMFWGIVGFLYVLFAGRAKLRMVEQPRTVIGRFFDWPLFETRTARFGDRLNKTICLYFVAAHVLELETHHRQQAGPCLPRKPYWEFADAEERDRYRSSWSHFPLFVRALATCLRAMLGVAGSADAPPSFAEAVESFAVAWYRAGWPVPEGYLAEDGLPPSNEAREYQLVRGGGDGRRPNTVIPCSLRTVAIVTEPEADAPMILRELTLAHFVALASLTTQGFMLFFMTVMMQPLVFAHLSGMQVLGAELPLPLTPKTSSLHVMEHWAGAAWGSSAAATTFMIGRYLEGPHLGVALLPYVPPPRDVVHTPRDRRRLLRQGKQFGWLTLAALASCAVADPAARAFASISAFARPVRDLADSLFSSETHTPVFAFGAMKAASMVSVPRLMLARTPTETLLARDAADASLLRAAILERVALDRHSHLEGWADRIRPPEVDLHEELAALLPDFSDPKLLSRRFARIYSAPVTKPLPRMPPQLARATPFCVRSPMQLLLPWGQRKVRRWVKTALDQLLCVEQGEEGCELLRPHATSIGQQAMEPWARGIVWDLTFERSECAVPLDFTLPIESGLNLPYLARRLEGYPDARLLSNLLEGVRFEADVELQTVLVPHLISLSKGFHSVRKELYRLHAKDWYRFFDHIPFWPIYLNGQGAAARKLEARYRRTTECGGPRKECLDESELAALSINAASVLHHFPQWYDLRRGEAEWEAWLEAKELLDPANRGTAKPGVKEIKPTLTQVMNDLSVLRAAAELLGEPIYVFGDDAKDYFNQLAIAPEDWWKLGVIFLHSQTAPTAFDLPRPPEARVFFVSERRLGFGAKLSSNIAQRFSESLLYLLRQDMDAAEAAAPFDDRPTMRTWRELRSRLTRLVDDQLAGSYEQRLYAVHMYTDDPIFIVVGVERALRLLKCWHVLVSAVRLEMAIPEKRNLGTWAPWLGVLLCAALGLVIVPKAKLLRTSERISAALSEGIEFGDYRSLIGMLEHLRCVNCAPSSVMYGLYAPHRSERVRLEGPSTRVALNPFMARQLEGWLDLIAHTGGAPVTAALTKAAAYGSITFTVSSDAATDSKPAGIGGFCHGFYWYLQVPALWLRWLHITVLEMLATGGSAMAFHRHLLGADQIVLQSDALATPYILSRHKAKSEMLALTHHALLANPTFADVAQRAMIAHLSGDCNPFADAISRALWERFYALCRVISVRPVEVAPPPALIKIIEGLVEVAKLRGQPVRQSHYVKCAPVLPAEMLGLGRRSPACEEADAVALSARLLARLNGGAAPTAGAPSSARKEPTAARPSANVLSARLHAALAAEPPVQAARVTNIAPSAPPVHANTKRPSTKPKRTAASALHAREIAGMRVLELPTAPASRTSLRDAAHACAAARADSFVRAGFANNHGVEQLTRLLQHAADLNDYGSSHGTRAKDQLAWEHWVAFAAILGFEPILSAEQVRDHPSHISTLLATFLLFVYPKMKGKQGRQWAKPRSAFAYVLAIIRIFRGWKLLLPPAKAVKGELHGLLRAYVNVYGVSALMPSRREPMRYSMIRDMQAVDNVRLGARHYRRGSSIGLAFRGILAVGWRTGHRLAEFVAHPSGELCYLTRGSVSFVIANVAVHDPTRAQLLSMRAGDIILIQPPRSKTDQFGEIHCPFPSSVAFSDDDNTAGFIIRQQELDAPCRGAARATTPLFADEHGLPFTHSVMDTLLHQMLVYCFGEQVASCYSWHSLRIGLATALKAAKCDDNVIQMVCRWTNPESLRAYARHGQSLHIDWVDRAEKAIIDAIQSASVPKVCNSEGNASLHVAFGGTRISKRAQAVLDAADDEDQHGNAVLEAADLSPLEIESCAGRRVLIARAMWPSFSCDENGGRGWTGRIVSCTRGGAATIKFLEATTARGIPYQDVTVLLSALEPI